MLKGFNLVSRVILLLPDINILLAVTPAYSPQTCMATLHNSITAMHNFSDCRSCKLNFYASHGREISVQDATFLPEWLGPIMKSNCKTCFGQSTLDRLLLSRKYYVR